MGSHAIPGFACLLWSGIPQAGPGAIEVDDDGVLAQGAMQHLGSGALGPFIGSRVGLAGFSKRPSVR